MSFGRSAAARIGAFALYAGIASASLAGCSASSPPQLPRVAGDPAIATKHRQSWMSPGASKMPNLLYVANQGDGTVSVYNYSKGNDISLVGSLAVGYPEGMCTDTAGNVFIVDYGYRAVYEYAHGGTTSLRTYSRHTGFPYACAVAKGTNDLAVSYEHPNGKYQAFAEVFVYPGEQMQPHRYTYSTGFFLTYFLAYDNKHDLFVDASPCVPYCYDSGGPPGLFELPAGGTSFQQISIAGASLVKPTALNWLNPALLVGDQTIKSTKSPGAYKVVVDGSQATVTGTIGFDGTGEANGFTVHARLVVVPDLTGNTVRIYNLSNGSLVSSFTQGLDGPFSAVISQAGQE